MNRKLTLRLWQRAVESLAAAKSMARESFNEAAVSRAYYAAFYAARAALSAADVSAPKSHHEMIAFFREHFTRSGEIEVQWMNSLQTLYSERQAADYDMMRVTPDDVVERYCAQSKEFIGRMRQYLTGKELTASELDNASKLDNS